MTNTMELVIGVPSISRLGDKGSHRARPGSLGIARYAHLVSLSSSLTLGGLTLAPLPGNAETIRFEDMLRGTSVTPQQCAATSDAVWVTPFGQGICMHYYFSDLGGRGTRAVVFINGDKPGIVPGSSGYGNPRLAKDTDTNKLLRHAQKISRSTRMPAVHLARMGLDGSSGSHRNRKTQLELQATNLALDAIKRRFGFQVFDVFGQSGGSTVAAGLLSVRRDIGCAVLGSGQLSLRPGHGIPAVAQWIRPFDAVRNTSARIIVLTDPNDQVVAREKQDAFVRHLSAAGRPVQQFYVTGGGDRHHNTTLSSLFVMSECLRNRSDQEIAEDLRGFVPGKVAAGGSHSIEPIEHENGVRTESTASANAADPICVQGSWAQAGAERQYVCLSWYFPGRLYAPTETAELAAQRSQRR